MLSARLSPPGVPVSLRSHDCKSHGAKTGVVRKPKGKHGYIQRQRKHVFLWVSCTRANLYTRYTAQLELNDVITMMDVSAFGPGLR